MYNKLMTAQKCIADEKDNIPVEKCILRVRGGGICAVRKERVKFPSRNGLLSVIMEEGRGKGNDQGEGNRIYFISTE
jgi:hypothetical protein